MEIKEGKRRRTTTVDVSHSKNPSSPFLFLQQKVQELLEKQKQMQAEIAKVESEGNEELCRLDTRIEEAKQQISDMQVHLAHQREIAMASPEKQAELQQGHLVLTESPNSRGAGGRARGGHKGRGKTR